MSIPPEKVNSLLSELMSHYEKSQEDKKVSDTEKSQLLAQIQSQENELAALRETFLHLDNTIHQFKLHYDNYISHLTHLLSSNSIPFPSLEQFCNSPHVNQEPSHVEPVHNPVTTPIDPTTCSVEPVRQPSPEEEAEPQSTIEPSPTQPIQPVLHPSTSSLQIITESQWTFNSIVCCSALSSDDTLLAVGYQGGFSIINLTTNEPRYYPLINNQSQSPFVRSLSFSSDSSYICAAMEERPILLVSIADGSITELGVPNSGVTEVTESSSICHSANGKFFCSTDQQVKLWECQSMSCVAAFGSEVFTCCAIALNSSYIIAGADNGNVLIIDVVEKKVLHLLSDHERAVHHVNFSPCSCYFVTSSLDNTSRVYHFDRDHCQLITVLRHHTDYILANCFQFVW
ncbi:hypothetical protein GEMRC1_007635 [Eukaryota sp. GEM-RC1]